MKSVEEGSRSEGFSTKQLPQTIAAGYIHNGTMTEKTELMSSRLVMTGAILVAGYLGLNPPGFAAGTVALAFGLAASSIFPALMMGIFSKKISGTAAVLGMLSGISITLLYVFQHKGIMKSK